MRTLIDLPDDQISSLAELGARFKRPRAALIREAISGTSPTIGCPGRGRFRPMGSTTTDGLKYQKKARAEW